MLPLNATAIEKENNVYKKKYFKYQIHPKRMNYNLLCAHLQIFPSSVFNT